MKTYAIRNQIREASELEGQTLFLYSELEQFFRKKGLSLNTNELEDTYEFTFNYITHVPELLEMIYKRAQKHNIRQHIQAIVSGIEDIFLSEENADEERLGLLFLLDKAYIAHSIMQSISDNYLLLTDKSLLPTNMTIANQLVSTLIGEKRRKTLDKIALRVQNNPIVQKTFIALLSSTNSFSISGPDPIWGYESVSDIAGRRLRTIEAV